MVGPTGFEPATPSPPAEVQNLLFMRCRLFFGIIWYRLCGLEVCEWSDVCDFREVFAFECLPLDAGVFAP